MTHQQFISLSQDKQYHKLLLSGLCIGHKDIEDHCILLFQLGDFYVEVFFDQNCDEIVKSRTFTSKEELQPYMEQLNPLAANHISIK